MDGIVDELSSTYDELVAATATALEAKQASLEGRTAEADAAMVVFKERLEAFRALCDQAEDMVERARHRIGSELLVDEATGANSRAPATGVPPISAAHLEQMSKAIRWLVIELQRGAGSTFTSATPPPPAAAAAAAAAASAPRSSSSGAPSDARFSEAPAR